MQTNPYSVRHHRAARAYSDVIVFAALIVAACLANAVVSCVGPTQRDPARFGTVRVAFGPSLDGTLVWRADQLAQLAPLFTELDALGPDFVESPEGEADFVVRAASLGGPCGLYTAGNRYVEVDAACAQGYLALRRAVGHELAHAYTWTRYHWYGHICQWPLNAPVPPLCHPTIRSNDALLSPGLVVPDDGPSITEAYTGSLADPTPAAADLELFAHCQAAGACVP